MSSHGWKVSSVGAFKRRPRWLEKGVAVFVAATIVASLAMPFMSVQGPPATAEAADLERSDVRPPLTDQVDTSAVDGFRHLPDFGNALHAIVVAPNGDIFAAGLGGEVDGNNDSDCAGISGTADAVDTNLDFDALCTGNRAAVYKSTDGGKSWRAAALSSTVPAASRVVDIAVSPLYPSDPFMMVVFHNGATGAFDPTGAGATAAGSGFAWSTDGGLTFFNTVIFGTIDDDGPDNVNANSDDEEDDFIGIAPLSIALSHDFNLRDLIGQVAISGRLIADATADSEAGDESAAAGSSGLTTVFQATASGFSIFPRRESTWQGLAEVTTPGVGDYTLSVRYSKDPPVALARLFVDAAGCAGIGGSCTHAQTASAGAWPALDAASALKVGAGGASMTANVGQIEFDDDYLVNGEYYAAASVVTVAGGFLGGTGSVWRFTGSTWSDETADEGAGCRGRPYSSLSVTGDLSTAVIIASIAGSNDVCRSTNAGASFRDIAADGGDFIFSGGNISPCEDAFCATVQNVSKTRVAGNKAQPTIVYWSSSGNLGGLARSASTGSSWQDTGLTNQPYVISANPTDASASLALVLARTPVGPTQAAAAGVPAGMSRDPIPANTRPFAVFKTENMGTTAGYTRVDRTPDVTSIADLVDFLVNGTVYLVRGQSDGGFLDGVSVTAKDTDAVLKSTNGGLSFNALVTDAFDPPEGVLGVHLRTATKLYARGKKGGVAVTLDGGAIWTKLAKDFGRDVDEMDFISDTEFFVTALDDDSMVKIWHTTDGGTTFGLIGDPVSRWGFHSGGATSFDLLATAYSGNGVLIAVSRRSQKNSVWRFDKAKAGEGWVDLEIVGTNSSAMTVTPGIGDGYLLELMGTTGFSASGGVLARTYYPLTLTKDNKSNLILQTVANPQAGGAIASCIDPAGRCKESTTAGRNVRFTFTAQFQAGPTLISPADGSFVRTNISDNGLPLTLEWSSIQRVQCWDVQMSLDGAFTRLLVDPISAAGVCPFFANGVIIYPVATVDPKVFSPFTNISLQLLEGQTYYWRVRARAIGPGLAGAALAQGPWSAASSFKVVPAQAVFLVGDTTSGQTGVTVNLSGSLFSPGETVQVTWDNPSTLFSAPTADFKGSFATSGIVPGGAPVGLHIIRAVGVTSSKSAGASFTVLSPTPPGAPTLRGAVTIGVPGPSVPKPPAGYQLDISVFPAGGTTPVAAQTVRTDGQGVFSVTLPDLTAGSYDIKVKGNHTLSRKKAAVALPQAPGALPLSFGTLRTGDLNGDDVILGADYSALVTNFGISGPEVASAASTLSSHKGLLPVALRLGGMPISLGEGDVFTVEVLLKAGEQPVDAVDVFLDFSTDLLQVVDEAGAPVSQEPKAGRRGILAGDSLPMLLYGRVDNAAGKVAFTVGRGMDDEPGLGSFTVAAVRFKAIAAVPASVLPYLLEHSESRMTAAYYRGEQLLSR